MAKGYLPKTIQGKTREAVVRRGDTSENTVSYVAPSCGAVSAENTRFLG